MNKANHGLIEEELIRIQSEYKNILLKAKDNIFKDYSSIILDEINVFWYKNKSVVECVLKYLYKPLDAFIFTGATILDISDLEHYPFVSLGKIHFLDDPICLYVNSISKSEKSEFKEEMKKHVIEMIEDNIKILEQFSNNIYILPIRFLDNENELIYEAAKQAFSSLFNEGIDFNNISTHLESIEDVQKALKSDIEDTLIFSESDDITLGIIERFNDYKKENIIPLSKSATDAEVFKFVLFGFFTQAFSIIFICAKYKLIPYLRNGVTYRYTILLANNFKEDIDVNTIMLKSTIAHLFYRTFNKEQVQFISFEKYRKALDDSNFEENVFSDIISKKNITMDNLSFEKIVNSINENFGKTLDSLK